MTPSGNRAGESTGFGTPATTAELSSEALIIPIGSAGTKPTGGLGMRLKHEVIDRGLPTKWLGKEYKTYSCLNCGKRFISSQKSVKGHLVKMGYK